MPTNVEYQPITHGIAHCAKCHTPYDVTYDHLEGGSLRDKDRCLSCQGPDILANGQPQSIPMSDAELLKDPRVAKIIADVLRQYAAAQPQ